MAVPRAQSLAAGTRQGQWLTVCAGLMRGEAGWVCCTVLFALAALAVGSPASAGYYWGRVLGDADKACYGPTVEVRLDNIGTILSVPIDARPELNAPRDIYSKAPGKGIVAWPARCEPEPVLVDSVYFYLSQKPWSALGLTTDGPMAQRMKIAGGGGHTLRGMFAGWRFDSINSGKSEPPGKPVEYGYIYRGPANNGPTSSPGAIERNGDYWAPPEYRTPAGERFALDCNFECRVSYSALGPAGKAGLQYWFVRTKVPMSQWIELDRRIRRAVEKMLGAH